MSCYIQREIGSEAVKATAKYPGIRTSELINILELSRKDLEILAGKQDTKFFQKVRSLVSHNSLKDKITHVGDKNRQRYLKNERELKCKKILLYKVIV